ncbi:MAG: alpha/beta fold hydrolase [Anaerolineae bacterium]|nr:alpha/beta fold hydrolase [Anaerolineae bacterium]
MFPITAFQSPEHEPFLWRGTHGGAALLVHGFPGTPAEMRPIASVLHAEGWTVRGLLLPGFGGEIDTLLSRRCEDWLDAVSSALAELRREHKTVLLVGHSMGGALAIAAAADLPPDGLILSAPFCKVEHVLWKMLPVLRHFIPAVPIFRYLKLNFDDPETRAGILKFMPDADLDDPQVRQAIQDFRLPINLFNEIRRAGVSAVQAAPHFSPATRVLVVQGDADDLVRPHLTRQLRQQFASLPTYHEVPGKHDLIVPGRDGWLHYERASLDFARLLLTSGRNDERTINAAD